MRVTLGEVQLNECIVSDPVDEQTGWLKTPDPQVWANVLLEIVALPSEAIVKRARESQKVVWDGRYGPWIGRCTTRGSVNGQRGRVGTLGVMLLSFLVAYITGPFLFSS